jgi:hypothetical protein
MVKLNSLVFEENSYVRDNKEVVYHVAFLDVTLDEYRYRIPLSCSDKGELASCFRKVKEQSEGIYELKLKA